MTIEREARKREKEEDTHILEYSFVICQSSLCGTPSFSFVNCHDFTRALRVARCQITFVICQFWGPCAENFQVPPVSGHSADEPSPLSGSALCPQTRFTAAKKRGAPAHARHGELHLNLLGTVMFRIESSRPAAAEALWGEANAGGIRPVVPSRLRFRRAED
jgi:hypothetical protein